ncbi:MAG TPA: cobalt ECF transporter T component CbiQ [Planctomycetota bacterium]|jgi:cobalt/nickel transport system permease protein
MIATGLESCAQLESPVHRLCPRIKLLATACLLVLVVSTPAAYPGVLAGCALLLALIALCARVPLGLLVRRAAVVLPFAAMTALFIPFLPNNPDGASYSIGFGLMISHAGLLLLWDVLVKSVLGALAVTLLVATTPFPKLLGGLEALWLPRPLVLITAFTYRYVSVLADEFARMKRARHCRCYEGRWLWHAGSIGRMAGTLFLRSYERGERVYLAMLARGYEFRSQNSEIRANSHEREGRLPDTETNERSASCKPQAAIEIAALQFSYPDGSQALDGISLRIESGERVGIIGANGAGKSTLLLHLNGIYSSDAVTICGLPAIKANLKTLRQKVGLIFQNPDDQLFCPTLFEDIAFGPRNLGVAPEEIERRVREGLKEVGLAGFEQRSAFHLSIGQKKRAAIAAVLAMQPEILVLDEPTSNLDPRGRRELIELLAKLGGTQIVATHNFDLVRALCTRVLVLSSGKIVGEGAPEALLADHALLTMHGLE